MFDGRGNLVCLSDHFLFSVWFNFHKQLAEIFLNFKFMFPTSSCMSYHRMNKLINIVTRTYIGWSCINGIWKWYNQTNITIWNSILNIEVYMIEYDLFQHIYIILTYILRFDVYVGIYKYLCIYLVIILHNKVILLVSSASMEWQMWCSNGK